ncbi:hypothetical protein RJ639_002187 [Escallonia herrerae]|uniref:RRM domain-containing protein n=1 Tax=Escallonia herrerae TaxID=1293975 RepID=A0AA88XGF4_9ASTE|nr:hypothetical protein RJ639_002187 [Escallonia herrerae]
MAATVATGTSGLVWASRLRGRRRELPRERQSFPPPLRLSSSSLFSAPLSSSILPKQHSHAHNGFVAVACLPSSAKSTSPSTKLYVSVNLVMDRIANRPRGFAFLRYATEDESKKAIDGMHGKGSLRRNGDSSRIACFAHSKQKEYHWWRLGKVACEENLVTPVQIRNKCRASNPSPITCAGTTVERTSAMLEKCMGEGLGKLPSAMLEGRGGTVLGGWLRKSTRRIGGAASSIPSITSAC